MFFFAIRLLEFVNLGDQLVKIPSRRFISSILLFVSQVSFQNLGERSGWWYNPVIGEFWLGYEL
jgi:hypothetical protein